MFFIFSKILWLLASPANVMTLTLGLGCALLLAGRLDHDVFGRHPSKAMKVIDSSMIEQDVVRKPVPTFRHRAQAWGFGLAVAAALMLLCFGVLPLGTLLLRTLENRFPPAALSQEAPTGIIVLGGAIDQVIGAARRQVSITDAATRITEAVVLARRYPQARLVYTGGSNALVADIGGEAADAARLWVAMGVDPARIVIEDRSRNTAENATFSRDLLRPNPGERWLLVTSAYHMPRAVALFRGAGFPVVPVPVDFRTSGTWRDFEPNRDVGVGLARFDFATREWVGLLAYRLAGKTSAFFPEP